MWNAGQRDNTDAFLMLACLGPFNAEETSRGREFDVENVGGGAVSGQGVKAKVMDWR